jgi:hypothetical protein
MDVMTAFRYVAAGPYMLPLLIALILGVVLWAIPQLAPAHCDTLDGPVVQAAREALAKGDIAPVLAWIQAPQEAELRAAFEMILRVRKDGKEAQELADMYFFETLVRLHRAGEGAPYTGLKPSGTDVGPAVSGADAALASGSVDALVTLVTGVVAEGIRERFREAAERRPHMQESIAAGREYVEAYVEFVHYVEGLYDDATAAQSHGEAAAASEAETQTAHHH